MNDQGAGNDQCPNPNDQGGSVGENDQVADFGFDVRCWKFYVRYASARCLLLGGGSRRDQVFRCRLDGAWCVFAFVIPGTAVPGYLMSPLRGWGAAMISGRLEKNDQFPREGGNDECQLARISSYSEHRTLNIEWGIMGFADD